MANDDALNSPELIAEEMKKFQGAWKQVRFEKDGLKEPPDEAGWEPTCVYLGDTFVVTLADGRIPIKGTFTIDPTQNPKALNLTDTFGEDAGKTFLAIYSLEGDEQIFVAADEGMERPTEFTTRPGHVLRACRRVVN